MNENKQCKRRTKANRRKKMKLVRQKRIAAQYRDEELSRIMSLQDKKLTKSNVVLDWFKNLFKSK